MLNVLRLNVFAYKRQGLKRSRTQKIRRQELVVNAKNSSGPLPDTSLSRRRRAPGVTFESYRNVERIRPSIREFLQETSREDQERFQNRPDRCAVEVAGCSSRNPGTSIVKGDEQLVS